MATNEVLKYEDDTKISETRGDRFHIRKYFQIMSSYIREIFFAITVIFTGIAALQNGPLKTKKANPPELFFKPPSLITDFYSGNFQHLISVASEKDVSLIMYYAPWDASCMHAREELELVAKFYHNEVFFAAINCWWPDGECRKRFDIHAYPILMVTVHEVGSFKYDGPIVSTYIISYLDSVLTPLVPLHNYGDLLELQTKHEAVLVGYFDFKNNTDPKGYKEFYYASLKALTKDPYRSICFAVVTNKKSATDFKLKSSIQMFLWNTTKVLSFDKPVNYEEMLKWTFSSLEQVTGWVSPPRSKSIVLSQSIEKHPTMILFTPRNLLLEYSPYYNLLKEIAFNYNNCNKSQDVESVVHRMVLKRHIMQEELTRIIEKCHKNETHHQPDICRQRPDLCDFTCCKSINLNVKLSEACQCRVCLHHIVANVQEIKLTECENTLSLILKNFNVKELGDFKVCSDIEVSLPVKFGEFKQLSFDCETESMDTTKFSKKQITNTEISELNDDLIVTMISNNEKRLCHRLKFAMNYSELNFPNFPISTDSASWISNFTGLGCRTNRTLQFIAMDVMLFNSFAENLGIDVTKKLHQTVAVIVEIKQENQFILNEQVNKKSLVEFIKNYAAGNLSRHLRMPVRKLSRCKEDKDANICLEDISTSQFSEVVMNDKDVVLFYYAPWCGPCKSISHIFLTVADYFSNVDGIKFARINGDENDLPWEYSVDKYPSIIFFPSNRKSESVEFPPHLEVTMTNLLHFVLVYAQPKVRWMVAMEMCNWECITNNLIRSAKELRRLFREHRCLVSDFHFTLELIHLDLPRTKTPSKRKPNINYLKSVYLKSVIERIHKKREQIHQALQLQATLRKKRTIHQNSEEKDDVKINETGMKKKHFNIRQKAKDEL